MTSETRPRRPDPDVARTTHATFDGQRALIYARVSLDRTGSGGSIERQVAACRKLADLRGWRVVATHTDRSISAYSGARRPGWERTLAAVKAGEIDVLLAWHVDRMTRSMQDLETLILLAEARGVGIATTTGDIDLTTDVGRMVARILAAVARAEVERKGQRQWLANQQRALAGQPHAGGHRAFGYGPDGRTVVPREAEALRAAATALLSGTSLTSVAKEWSAAGLASSRSATGGWTVPGVRAALLNPRYAGLRAYKGRVVADAAWPAIFDLQTHHELVAMLKAPLHGRRKSQGGRTPTTLLTGIARCAVCDGTLKGWDCPNFG